MGGGIGKPVNVRLAPKLNLGERLVPNDAVVKSLSLPPSLLVRSSLSDTSNRAVSAIAGVNNFKPLVPEDLGNLQRRVAEQYAEMGQSATASSETLKADAELRRRFGIAAFLNDGWKMVQAALTLSGGLVKGPFPFLLSAEGANVMVGAAGDVAGGLPVDPYQHRPNRPNSRFLNVEGEGGGVVQAESSSFPASSKLPAEKPDVPAEKPDKPAERPDKEGPSSEEVGSPLVAAVEGRKGEVEVVLDLQTLNSPLESEGVVIEASEGGSGQYDRDWLNTMIDYFGVRAYAHMPSRYPRSGNLKSVLFNPEKAIPGIPTLPFGIPMFTKPPKFYNLKADQVRDFLKTMQASINAFVGYIEKTEGRPLQMMHSGHLFVNNLFAGLLNQLRHYQMNPLIPSVATCHGTAVKLFQMEEWFAKMHEPHPFGADPDDPNNKAIPRRVVDLLLHEYGEILSLKSPFAKRMDISPREFLEEMSIPKQIGWRELIAPFIYRGVGQIIAISDDIQQQVFEAFPEYPTDHVKVIYNGYNPNKHRPMDLDRREVLSGLKLARLDWEDGEWETKQDVAFPVEALNADYIVVMTGKYVSWKGIDQVIRAAAGIDVERGGRRFEGYEAYFRRRGKKVVTIIMGWNGKEPEYVRGILDLPEQLGAENIYFLGNVPHETIAAVNNIADVTVYPSRGLRGEPFGLTAIEAAAVGAAVLVGKGSFFAKMVAEGVAVKVDEDDPENIGTNIRRAIDEDWKSSMGPRALEFAPDYTWDKVFGKYVDMYEQVYDWTVNKHPLDVYHPRRVTRAPTLKEVELRLGDMQMLFGPYKTAVEFVLLFPRGPEDSIWKEAAKAAMFIKCGLRHGEKVDFNQVGGDILAGRWREIYDRAQKEAEKRGLKFEEEGKIETGQIEQKEPKQ